MLRHARTQPGFMMAMIVIMMISSVSIIMASFILVGSTNFQTQNIVYRQISYEAARSSMDMAKYHVDGDFTFNELKPAGCDNVVVLCTNDTTPRNGTPDAMQERTISSSVNTKYRTTTQILTVQNGSDARSKRVSAIGRVYIPATSTVPKFSRIVIGEVVVDTVTATSPSTFSPMAWYDATCNPSDPITNPFRDAACVSDTVLASGVMPSPGDLVSYKEERTNGTACGSPSVPSSSTLIYFAKGTGANACGSNQQIHTGIAFKFPTTGGLDQLKGRTITNARLKILNKSNPIGGTSNIIIRGLHQPNASFSNFTSLANNELLGATTSASTTVSFPASNSDLIITNPQLTAMVQELINDARYSNGENLYLRFEATNGSQSRRQSDAVNGSSGIGIILELEFGGTTSASLAGGDQPISLWLDRSGNGFTMVSRAGAQPTYSLINENAAARGRAGQPVYDTTTPLHPEREIRHLPAVHLQNGISGRTAAMSAEVRASSLRRSTTYTVLGVLRAYDETDKSFSFSPPPANNAAGTLVSFYGGTWASPIGTGGRTYAPFWRHPDPKPDGTGYHGSGDPDARQICNAMSTSRSDLGVGAIMTNERGCYSIHYGATSDVDTPWFIGSTRSQSYSRANYFRVNGANTVPQVYVYETPQLNAPYQISLAFDQLDALVTGGSFSIGELIIYDRELSCPQIETIEAYLADKWRLRRTPQAVALGFVYETHGCYENNIPTF